MNPDKIELVKKEWFNTKPKFGYEIFRCGVQDAEGVIYYDITIFLDDKFVSITYSEANILEQLGKLLAGMKTLLKRE